MTLAAGPLSGALWGGSYELIRLLLYALAGFLVAVYLRKNFDRLAAMSVRIQYKSDAPSEAWRWDWPAVSQKTIVEADKRK